VSFIEVSKGGNAPDDWKDGTYEVELTGISDPRTITAQRGPNAGQDMDLIDWEFAIVGGAFSGQTVEASTTMATGPKSKMYGFLTALFGAEPPIGTRLEKSDLIGRHALAAIQADEGGWLKIKQMGALPTPTGIEQAAQAAPATGIEQAAQAAEPTPLKAQVAADAERKLPF